MSTVQAQAEAAPEDMPATQIIVEFRGGVVGASMAEVLNVFSSPGVLRLKPYTVQATDKNWCAVLKNQIQVGASECTDLLVSAIGKIHGGREKTPFPRWPSPGYTVWLPDIHTEFFTFKRVYNLAKEKERSSLQAIEKNPAWQKKLSNEQTLELDSEQKIKEIALDGIRWKLSIDDSKFINFAEVQALELTNPNRYVRLIKAEEDRKERSKIKKRFDMNPTQLWQKCINSDAKPEDKAAYENYLKRNSYYNIPSDLIKCEGDVSGAEVVVLDQPVHRHPDLVHALPHADAADDGTAAHCKTVPYDRSKHHGTFLAGIIASINRSSGLLGIYPKVKLTPFSWMKGVTEKNLEDFIQEHHNLLKSQVFLFASEFSSFPRNDNPIFMNKIWAKRGNGWSNEELTDHAVVFKIKPINRILIDQKILFIVSAGQPETEGSGISLRDRTPMSPQNLGQYPNIIVVTACSNCDREEASIWDQAYRSEKGASMVHIAAPGGEGIVAIASDDGNEHGIAMSPAGGTSAAAAFTAGVAANMLACYPNSYRGQPGRLKEWLILTSRANVRPEDQDGLAGGVLDPGLALVPPDKSWLKSEGAELREVQIVHWCDRSLALEGGDGEPDAEPINLKSMRRLLKSGDNVYVGRTISRDSSSGFSEKLFAKSIGPGKPPDPRARLALIESGGDKCVATIGYVHDLILSKPVKNTGACERMKLCE